MDHGGDNCRGGRGPTERRSGVVPQWRGQHLLQAHPPGREPRGRRGREEPAAGRRVRVREVHHAQDGARDRQPACMRNVCRRGCHGGGRPHSQGNGDAPRTGGCFGPMTVLENL